jgi:predicted enzyme related to lactoylglutathione lyase
MATKRTSVIASTPLLVVSDLQRSVDFYTQRLGYREPGVWGQPPCFAMMHRDGFDLMLSLAETPDRVRPNGPGKVWDMYLKVEDLEAEAKALAEAGVPLDRPISRTPYNMIELEIVDPDGYRVCFGQELD